MLTAKKKMKLDGHEKIGHQERPIWHRTNAWVVFSNQGTPFTGNKMYQGGCGSNPAHYFSDWPFNFWTLNSNWRIAKRKVKRKNHKKDEEVRGSVVKKITRLEHGSSPQVVISGFTNVCQWLNEKYKLKMHPFGVPTLKNYLDNKKMYHDP